MKQFEGLDTCLSKKKWLATSSNVYAVGASQPRPFFNTVGLTISFELELAHSSKINQIKTKITASRLLSSTHYAQNAWIAINCQWHVWNPRLLWANSKWHEFNQPFVLYFYITGLFSTYLQNVSKLFSAKENIMFLQECLKDFIWN